MQRVIVLVSLCLVAGCADTTTAPTIVMPRATSLTPPPAPPPVIVASDLSIGESAEGVIGDGKGGGVNAQYFSITPPSDGTMVVSLSWDTEPNGTLLSLRLADRLFVPVRPNWSPVVGALPVEAGHAYLVEVGLFGSDWLPFDRFVLTSRLEAGSE